MVKSEVKQKENVTRSNSYVPQILKMILKIIKKWLTALHPKSPLEPKCSLHL